MLTWKDKGLHLTFYIYLVIRAAYQKTLKLLYHHYDMQLIINTVHARVRTIVAGPHGDSINQLC